MKTLIFRNICILFLFISLCTLFSPALSMAKLLDSTVFLTIDQQEYTVKDFRQWWEYWRDADSVFPDTPEEFINWQLLSREAMAMELDREPSFTRKIDIFLKARALMFLKNEAVDSRLSTSEAELEEIYNEKYSPRWQTAVLYFKDLAAAEKAVKLLEPQKGADLPDLKRDLHGLEISYSSEKLYRPVNIPDNWQESFLKLEKWQTSPPLPMGEGYVVIYIFSKTKTSIKNNSTDYYEQRDTIKSRLIRQKQAQYTDKLIRTLLKKYKVEIDEDLLAAIDISKPQDNLLPKKLISTTRGDVSVADFLENIKRNQRIRQQDLTDKKAQTAEKWRVARGIISQSVTTWESLDRHYEEREPFRTTYKFYRQHRLLKELDRLIFQKNIIINEADIVEYYHRHVDEFTAEPTISYNLAAGSYLQIKKLWANSLSNGNMEDLAKKYSLKIKHHKRVPISQIAPELAGYLAKLNPDELSMPLKNSKGAVLVHLISRQTVGDRLPMTAVHDKIRHVLAGLAVAEAKNKFINGLKDRSNIRLYKSRWQQLSKELTK